jgi:hypothetical protein
MKNLFQISGFLAVILLLSIIFLFFSLVGFLGAIIISILILSVLVVPVTFIWSKITGESYDRVCDNSEIVYQLNRVGKWSIVALTGFLIISGIYMLIFNHF